MISDVDRLNRNATHALAAILAFISVAWTIWDASRHWILSIVIAGIVGLLTVAFLVRAKPVDQFGVREIVRFVIAVTVAFAVHRLVSGILPGIALAAAFIVFWIVGSIFVSMTVHN